VYESRQASRVGLINHLGPTREAFSGCTCPDSPEGVENIY
jgi:hypothetical protein